MLDLFSFDGRNVLILFFCLVLDYRSVSPKVYRPSQYLPLALINAPIFSHIPSKFPKFCKNIPLRIRFLFALIELVNMLATQISEISKLVRSYTQTLPSVEIQKKRLFYAYRKR